MFLDSVSVFNFLNSFFHWCVILRFYQLDLCRCIYLPPLENETAAAVITLGNQKFIDYIPTVGVHGGAHGTPVIIPECASER